jgi:superkiller protein 3
LWQNKSADNTLERQLELQQMEQELLAEPAAPESRTAEELESQGDRHLLQGDINKAYFCYFKGLTIEPDRVSLLHKQGALLIKKNKNPEAEKVYQRLLSLDNKDAQAHEGLGKTYFGLGKSGEAEKSFLTALELKPELWQAHEYLGLISSQRQDYQQAISRFNAALVLKPGRTSITNNLAVTYYINGDFSEAAQLLRVLAAKTKDPKVYNNLALCSFRLGNYQEALESFKMGSGSEAAAYNNIGREYLSVKKYDQAIESFERAIALHPKFYPSAQKNLDLAKRQAANVLATAVK